MFLHLMQYPKVNKDTYIVLEVGLTIILDQNYVKDTIFTLKYGKVLTNFIMLDQELVLYKYYFKACALARE